MKSFVRFVITFGLISLPLLANSDSITDTYSTGDTLTATTLNNIKSAVNDNNARTTSLENSQTVQDTDIDTLESDQQALQTNDAAQDTRLDTLEAADLINRITALENALAAHIADLANPHAVTKAQIGLSNLEDIRVNYTATTAPTVTDDVNSGYTVGSVWIDTTDKEAYILVDNASGAAVWKRVSNNYAIGDTGPAGGIVFYITDNGLHGLEAAPVDQFTTEGWGCQGTLITGADGTAIGTGAQNTADILAGCPTAGTAAALADTYTLNGFDDWFLPSKDELHLLYLHKPIIGGFAATDVWWSSSERDDLFAWLQQLFSVPGQADGIQFAADKIRNEAVRAIRAF